MIYSGIIPEYICFSLNQRFICSEKYICDSIKADASAEFINELSFSQHI
jgi:hypothetical protein